MSSTKLSKEEEQRFQTWIKGTGWYSEFKKEYGEEPDLNDRDYDYRAAWKAGIKPERYAPDNNRYHWPSSLPSGKMLKSSDHPTAWKETFMRQTGHNPDEIGVKTKEQATEYVQRSRSLKMAKGGVVGRTNEKLWESAKAQAKAKMGGKHSARAMQLAGKIYKEKGGSYSGKKTEAQKSLSKWTDQEWTTSSGKPSEGKRRYLPKAAWSALSESEKKATNAAKAAGNKAGKQFVAQPEKVAAKAAKFRK
jgi:hypothetical protein